MNRTGFAAAFVLDATGAVLGGSGDERLLDEGSADRVALPNGQTLLLVRHTELEPWSRLARAFIHEVRSPLNALGIYLELLGSRVGPDPQRRPEASSERLLDRAHNQVKRVDDLLKLFGALWAPQGKDVADVALLARAAWPLVKHEALRLGVTVEDRICESATAKGDDAAIADALVTLLGGALRSAPESRIGLAVAREGGEVVLELTVSDAAAPLAAGVRALARAGARVEAGTLAVRAAFPGI